MPRFVTALHLRYHLLENNGCFKKESSEFGKAKLHLGGCTVDKWEHLYHYWISIPIDIDITMIATGQLSLQEFPCISLETAKNISKIQKNQK